MKTVSSNRNESAEMPDRASLKLSVFMLVKTNRSWLDMPPVKRFAFLDEEVRPLLQQCTDVRMRFFDSESFNARATDVIFWEVENIAVWQWMCDKLRETRFWGDYFDIVEILPALENGYSVMYAAPIL